MSNFAAMSCSVLVPLSAVSKATSKIIDGFMETKYVFLEVCVESCILARLERLTPRLVRAVGLVTHSVRLSCRRRMRPTTRNSPAGSTDLDEPTKPRAMPGTRGHLFRRRLRSTELQEGQRRARRSALGTLGVQSRPNGCHRKLFRADADGLTGKEKIADAFGRPPP
jgi:hypothetical protein